MKAALGLSLVLIAGSVSAQEAAVRAEVDSRKVGVQDQVELTISVEGRSVDLAEDVALPPLQNLRVVVGPSLSTQVSFVNGAVSQSKTYTWVLQPVATGRAEVGAARIKLASGEKATAAIAIEVVPGSIRARTRAADPFDADPFESLLGRRRRPAAEPKLVVLAEPSRTRLYVGEPLLLTYFVYTQTSVTDLKFTDAPQYPGFWSEDLEKPASSPSGEPATLEGESYRRFAFLQKLLFPTRAGTLTIPAASLHLGLPRESFFDPGPNAIARSTRPIVVNADPVPVEAGFAGAVGKFRVTAAFDKASVPFGEAATLRFQVQGKGNLKWIDQAPEVEMPGAKVYPPQVKSDLKVEPTGMGGSKTWEFVVVPETTGTLEVPALSFAYFDPSAARVVRTQAGPLQLRVDASGDGPAGPLPARAAAVPRGAGALRLRSDLDLPSRNVPILGTRFLAFAVGIVVLLHGALGVGSRVVDWRRRSEGRTAPRRSLRAALADLDRAGRGGMTKEAAAVLIERTLHDLFGPVDESGGAADEREQTARGLLQEVHFIRYAPQLGDYSEKIRDVAARAAAAVRRWA